MSQEKKEKKADIRKIKRRIPNQNIWLAVGASVLLALGWMFITNWDTNGKEVPLSNIVNEISKENYEKIILKDNLVVLEKESKKKVGGQEVTVTDRKHALLKSGTDFYTVLADADIDIKELNNDFFEPAVPISIVDILWLALLGAGLVLMYMMIKGMQSQGSKLSDFGQSKARMMFGKKTKIDFDSVAGIEDVKEELIEIVDFLKHPKKYVQVGARIPRGVLLSGAPGTGKTLLAKAVAGEAGVPFFHTSGSEFEEMLVGAGASRVRDLFTKAKRAAPCIIFIDEIDAVAKKRGTVLHSGGGEQTLNQILVEMDGLEERENVIVLGATNRPDVLDPAILRPGRFDRTVTVHMPDNQERRAILDVHAANKKFDKSADLDVISKKTTGYSGADLENLLNEAAIMAARADKKEISQNDLLESYLKVKLGRQKKNKRTEEDIKRVAYHEAGHAVAAKFTKGASPVEKVSIISRGASGGVTVYTPEDDTRLTTKSKLLSMLVTGVAGKIAEEVFLGEMSTGASGDIEQVTQVAKVMVKNYGMSEKLGFVEYGKMEDTQHMGYSYGGGSDYSDKTAQSIDAEVKDMMDVAQKSARDILTKQKKKVEELVAILLEREEVNSVEFNALFA